MSACVILFRDTTTNRVDFVMDVLAGGIATFPDFDAALAATQDVLILLVYPWQIVELEV